MIITHTRRGYIMDIHELNKIFGKGLNFKKAPCSNETPSLINFTLEVIKGEIIEVTVSPDMMRVTRKGGDPMGYPACWCSSKREARDEIRRLFYCCVDDLFMKLQEGAAEGLTRAEYMKDSTKLHHSYHLQFAIKDTIRGILEKVGIDALRASRDGHLNDVKIPFNNLGKGGSWWWDTLAYNREKVIKVGEGSTQSTRTCIAKSVARFLLQVDNATS